jgi:hypothetical protein
LTTDAQKAAVELKPHERSYQQRNLTFHQGDITKKSYLTAVVILTYVLGLYGGARADDASRIVVNVPFDFVAGGETFPAVTYSVSRVSTETRSDLLIRSDDKSALLLPIVFDKVPAERAKLGFEHG